MKTVVHYKTGPYLPITETWIYGQIKNLQDYRPFVYATSTQNLDIFPTNKIRTLESKNLRVCADFNKKWNSIFNFYPIFAFFLGIDKPNLVHAHFGPSGYDFLTLKRIFRLPLITSFYGYDLSMLPSQHPEWRTKYKILFQEGEAFLVEGNHMKKCLHELGCPEEKIIVQHLGIDLDQIKFIPRKCGNDEEIKVLISSSFKEKKGIPYAIEAFREVKHAHPELKLKLTIIGDSRGIPEEENEKKKILDLIKKYDLKNCIDMLGYQPYSIFLELLYRHHIFLHPSVHAIDGDTEGGAPVSIIEASASGLPILSTTHCDIPEVVKDGDSGYLAPERNIETLAKKLELLVLESNSWDKMGFSGRKHIEQNYNVKKQVQQLEAIYDKFVH